MFTDLVLPPLLVFGPVVVAGALAAPVALRRPRPWGAFLTGSLGTLVLATGLGLVVDWLEGPGFYPAWLLQAVLSLLPAVAVGACCAARVEKRNRSAGEAP